MNSFKKNEDKTKIFSTFFLILVQHIKIIVFFAEIIVYSGETDPHSGDVDPSVSEGHSVGQSCFDLSKQSNCKVTFFFLTNFHS